MMTMRPLPEESLFTPQEAAAKLNMSVKALMEHVRAGRIRYINIGSGNVRKRHRFTAYNLQTFIENQKIMEVPARQSTSVSTRAASRSCVKRRTFACPRMATKTIAILRDRVRPWG